MATDLKTTLNWRQRLWDSFAHYLDLLRYLLALPLWLALDWYCWQPMPFQGVAWRLWFALLPAIGFAFHPLAWWQPLPADWGRQPDEEGPAI